MPDKSQTATSNPGTNRAKTVRVRVLVGVDKDGGWVAEGSSKYKPDYRPIVDADSYVWLEADVDIPEEDTLTAFVIKDTAT